MSVITSRSTLLSILKTPNAGPRSSFHRVRFQLPKDIKKIFLDFKNGSNVREYENLVCTIRDSEISDSDLLSLLREARNCISILNYDLKLFVQALIVIQWTNRSETVVKYYQEFMNDLVSAHTQHTKVVIDQLVKLFLNSEETEWTNDEPNEYQRAQFHNIHFILQSILETIPMSEDILLLSLKHNFPYVKVSAIKQVSFLYNTLRVIDYQPDLRTNILHLVVDKLLSLDVLAPRDEILQAEEEPDMLFEMEVDEDTVTDIKNVHMKHTLGDTLDIMMSFLFNLIEKTCFEEGELMWESCQQLFNEMLYVFENVVLSTHACHHIQFIMFYMCSFHRTLTQEFLKYLWRKINSPSIPSVIRQNCVAYLASFLARANFAQLNLLKLYLSKLTEWIHNYILNHDGAHSYETDIKQHSMFYSICQATFYLIAFKHLDLVDTKSNLVFLQGLNLSKIVTCKLNPLRVCLPTITENFAAVTRACQLAYCYTIIENNTRNRIPLIKSGGEGIINPVLDMYFPFDHYVLKRTNSYIVPLYQEYKPMSNEEESKSKRQNSASEDDDDFIRDSSLGRLSITPIKNVSRENFSYAVE